MKIVQSQFPTVDSLSKDYRRREINLRPPYQRPHEGVWNLKKKQLLVDTILRTYDMPKIYLRAIESDSEVKYEVVDGQQRIRAMWEFIDGKFELGDASSDLPSPLGDLSGKDYESLASEIKDRFSVFPLSVYEIQQADEEEIRELFQRLQEGTSLNPAERRNAMMGGMRDFVASMAGTDDGTAPHSVLPLTRLSSKRCQWDDLIALVTCIELDGGPTNIKAVDLRRMYRDRSDFSSQGTLADAIRRNLNFMTRVLRDQPPEMDIKWGFVDLYLLVSRLRRDYDVRGREPEFADFYIEFEQTRRSVEDEGALAESRDPWDRDMFDYIQNFKTGGGKREAVDARHHVYLRRILFMIDDLVPKDSQRTYNHNERMIIWRRAHEKCESCSTSLTLDEMQADHRIPHAAGGTTTISNGQALCAMCHQDKTAAEC